ncbi:hypothetical protein LBBP_02614 [Leptospira borgpetersenii serovar Ballum]|uniref:Uncharacterized protein n=1 Tax=Leptospira borgpetersenii serovar Ballum TaxID=280505 RepID=A0A0S2IT56_LEPBO|nr:hypothetical protein LBBP_02614 [Leptospira borgpetersenii serovar Ballum]
MIKIGDASTRAEYSNSIKFFTGVFFCVYFRLGKTKQV